jgi:hypothetical protein
MSRLQMSANDRNSGPPAVRKVRSDRLTALAEDRESAIYFANQLRSARLAVLADAEGFEVIIHAIERLGSYLEGEMKHLDRYSSVLLKLAEKSDLSGLPSMRRNFFTPVRDLYEWVRDARNDALHQGAFARHLTVQTIKLAIIFEDAVKNNMTKPLVVSDLMVTNPICAELWQPVGFIRQQMLSNSFSYLPVFFDGAWRIISDVSVAKFLEMDPNTNNRSGQLSKILEDAVNNNKELLDNAVEVPPNLERAAALKKMKPDGNTDKSTNVLLVTEPSQESLGKKDSEKSRLVGILTAFDLL